MRRKELSEKKNAVDNMKDIYSGVYSDDDLFNFVDKLHLLEKKVVKVIDKEDLLSRLIEKTKLKEVEVMRALKWLENKGLVKISKISKKRVVLDVNGRKYLNEGLPEIRFLKVLYEDNKLHENNMIENNEMEGKSKNEIFKETKLSEVEFNVSVGVLKQKLAIDILDGFRFRITKQGINLLSNGFFEQDFLKRIDYLNGVYLDELSSEDKLAYENLKKRKEIIKVVDEKDWIINCDDSLLDLKKIILEKKKNNEEVIDKITPELIKKIKHDKSLLKKVSFRHFDVKSDVPLYNSGRIHFVNEAIEYVKQIWLDLGFKEMEGNIIQTVFWDLDCLFVPQDHPARDMQDTFYLDDKYYEDIDEELLERVKNVHENGGDTNSEGWQNRFDKELSKNLVLRTHTTVLSAQTIHKLKEGDIPAKYFSVGKVFRNETLDWKHLFEFYQVEGIVVDYDANLMNLKGYLTEFYKKMGFDKIRIRPSYFPYTEPSAEVEVFIEERNEWLELGGAGIFRPEVTKTLIGKEVPVLAWGLGLGRIITSYFNITDLRDLYKNDLNQLRNIKRFVKL